jgi:hypothetical protein
VNWPKPRYYPPISSMKVPGPPGHLCSRCAMTRESRARHTNNCPLHANVADLCPYAPKPAHEPKDHHAQD